MYSVFQTKNKFEFKQKLFTLSYKLIKNMFEMPVSILTISEIDSSTTLLLNQIWYAEI